MRTYLNWRNVFFRFPIWIGVRLSSKKLSSIRNGDACLTEFYAGLGLCYRKHTNPCEESKGPIDVKVQKKN